LNSSTLAAALAFDDIIFCWRGENLRHQTTSIAGGTYAFAGVGVPDEPT
jgi:hypothetical protein